MKTHLHLGVGNFHRAHQAWYTARAGGNWSVLGVSLRRSDVRDALISQGWRYTLAIKDEAGMQYEPINVFRGILVAPEDPGAVLEAIADATTDVITVTVTEKGYTLDNAGVLDLAHVDIQHDLASPLPRSLVGFLARGLARRAASGASPLTVLSCDNLSGNGRLLRDAVMRFADVAQLDLVLDEAARFPNTMVDRITPATTEALVAECQAASTQADAWPVETEAFSEWVIEDCVIGALPDWARAGARFVADVEPFELRKLRLLNGTHTLMAHLGRWRGHVYVHEAIADPVIRTAVDALMDEAVSTLPDAACDGIADYRAALLSRYANPALQHALAQIALDSSVKLGVRVVPVLVERAARGEESPACVGALAAWAAQTLADVAAGDAVSDPASAAIHDAAQRVGIAAQVDALLDLLSDHGELQAFRDQVLAAWPTESRD